MLAFQHAGLVGSMGRVGAAGDNAGLLQKNVLNTGLGSEGRNCAWRSCPGSKRSTTADDASSVASPDGVRDDYGETGRDSGLTRRVTKTFSSPEKVSRILNHRSAVGAVDVFYDDGGGARAALVVCSELSFSSVEDEYVADIAQVEPYEPGALFRRELPCIRAVLTLGPQLDLLVIDGYATLDPQGRPGLGAHASDAIGVPVIGVAKTPFRTATHAAEVIRGIATRPLYITAAGLEVTKAAQIVRTMAGPNRIPDALARVDRLARGYIQPIIKRGEI